MTTCVVCITGILLPVLCVLQGYYYFCCVYYRDITTSVVCITGILLLLLCVLQGYDYLCCVYYRDITWCTVERVCVASTKCVPLPSSTDHSVCSSHPRRLYRDSCLCLGDLVAQERPHKISVVTPFVYRILIIWKNVFYCYLFYLGKCMFLVLGFFLRGMGKGGCSLQQ